MGYFPGPKIGFGGNEARQVMRDWGSNGRNGKYIIKNDSFDYEKALSKLSIPVLVISIKGDTLAPPKASQYLYHKFSEQTSVQHEMLDATDTQKKSLTHFNWAKHPNTFWKIVENWKKEI